VKLFRVDSDFILLRSCTSDFYQLIRKLVAFSILLQVQALLYF